MVSAKISPGERSLLQILPDPKSILLWTAVSNKKKVSSPTMAMIKHCWSQQTFGSLRRKLLLWGCWNDEKCSKIFLVFSNFLWFMISSWTTFDAYTDTSLELFQTLKHPENTPLLLLSKRSAITKMQFPAINLPHMLLPGFLQHCSHYLAFLFAFDIFIYICPTKDDSKRNSATCKSMTAMRSWPTCQAND